MAHRRFARLAVAASLIAVLAACRTPGPVGPVRPEIPQDCPDPPPAMSAVEELRELGRAAREARANLMAHVRITAKAHAGATTQPASVRPTFATLHPPQLALLEATLDAPGKARQMEPAWLREHLLSTAVELHAPAPLADLDGDLRRVALIDGKGVRHTGLYMMARSDSQGWTYRIVFDPHAVKGDKDLTSVRLELPLGDRTATARWGVSSRTLDEIDGLPIIHLLARLREVRWARWDVAAGDAGPASDHLKDLLACAPDLEPASLLQQALGRSSEPLASATVAVQMLSLSRLPAAQEIELGAEPTREIAMRAALLARIAPLAAKGLVRGEGLLQAQRALALAAAALTRRDLAAIPEPLVEVDKQLATILADALDVHRPLATATAITPLQVVGGPHLSDDEVRRELRARLVLANAGLAPRWVRGSGDRRQLLEMRPVQTARLGGVVAKLHRRMGQGWIHPGLPVGEYATSFADHSAEIWSDEVRSLSRLEDLRGVARRLLRTEILGPEGVSVALAMAGLVQLEGAKAMAELLPLVQRGGGAQIAGALRALASLRDQQVTAAVSQATRATGTQVRAAAMIALGQRAQPDERGLLRAGLQDREPEVAQAALQGLLQLGDAEGIKTARLWLTKGGAQREAVLSLAARQGAKLATLGPDLLRLLRTDASRTVVGAVGAVLQGGAAAPLARLYGQGSAPLRSAIVEQARGEGFEAVLRRAAVEGDAALRQAALLALAALKRPPRLVFEKAVQDSERAVRLAAHVGLARLGEASSLLALGEGARGTCAERAIVLPTLCQSMDRGSRGRLLLDALQSDCPDLFPVLWEQIVRHQPEDAALLRASLAHVRRQVRVQAALVALGLRTGAARGEIP